MSQPVDFLWGLYRIDTGANDQPLVGIPATIVSRHGTLQSGYDCFVECDARACAEAYAAAGEYRSVDDAMADFEFQQMLVDDKPGVVLLEACEAEELVEMTR